MATVTRPAQYECLARDRTMTTTPICPAPAGAPEQRLAPEPLTPIILTAPEEFRDWLRTLAPTDVCGQPQWSNGCPLARYLRVRNGCPYEEASVERDRYTLGRARYPLPRWARRFVMRVDHAPAYWQRPATRGITAAEALLLLEDLCDNGGDGIARQEGQDGGAGHATRDDGLHSPHPGDDPAAGGAAVCGPDGTPPWRSWPLLTLPLSSAPPRAPQTRTLPV